MRSSWGVRQPVGRAAVRDRWRGRPGPCRARPRRRAPRSHRPCRAPSPARSGSGTRRGRRPPRAMRRRRRPSGCSSRTGRRRASPRSHVERVHVVERRPADLSNDLGLPPELGRPEQVDRRRLAVIGGGAGDALRAGPRAGGGRALDRLLVALVQFREPAAARRVRADRQRAASVVDPASVDRCLIRRPRRSDLDCRG